ncbi:MAG TPA: hypothetical protein VFV81_02010, partial [Verrucomicrobiae bacterium]|nr:hypothetical protein [Verrucomicrobiae bacterium]
DTNIVLTTNSVLTGIALGSATVHISYSGFTNVLAVTVRNPVFADGFTVSHDYVADGVTNSPWDGIYAESTNIPDMTYVPAGGSATLEADANISSNGVLTVTNLNQGYEFNQDDGFFLFKYVPADFQMAVDLLNYTNNGTENYLCAGLMARGYTISTNGVLGAPMDEAGNECWIAWERFDEFGIGTRYELTVDSGTQRPANSDVNGPDHWMLMARVGGTNFYFFQRASTNAPWHATGIGHLSGQTAVAKFAGQPMQVGMMLSGFNSGTPVNVGFANFMLDLGSPSLSISASTNGPVISWPGAPGVVLEYTTDLTAPNWQPVPGTPAFVNGQYQLPISAGLTNAFFRLTE